jgi:predicted phosphodiesterase
MKLCVISDLHCKYALDPEKAPTETILISTKPRKPANHHPVAAMLNAIDSDTSIKSDYLLCLGDLGDKADEQGIMSAWGYAEEIKNKLGAKRLIGLPGNHDINSRKINEKEPFSYIKNFHETFPTDDSVCNSNFWSNGYCILVDDDMLFLLINTVHDHTDENKALVAGITPNALGEIRKNLSSLDMSKIKHKVCVMHHHPTKHSNIENWRDGDSLDKGDQLIKLLGEHFFDIVIHGHKHQPRIKEENVCVFAAGSFSCHANLQNTGYQQMFHVIDLENEPVNKKGRIHSWEFTFSSGWTKNLNEKFPSDTGYGSKLDLNKVAERIKEKVQANGKKILFDVIIEEFPDIVFLCPDNMIKLSQILDSHGIRTNPVLPIIPETVSFKNR